MNGKKLKLLREKIDSIDQKIVLLLGERFYLVKEIAHLKKNGIEDKKREDEILSSLKRTGKTKKIEPEFIDELYGVIFSYSKKIQNKIKNEY